MALTNLQRFFHLHSTSLLLLLIGCSRTEGELSGYGEKSGDLGAFILQQGLKFGAHAQRTNGLPPFTAKWRYKEDVDGFQIHLPGDHFAELQAFLNAAYGPPAKPATTNEFGGTKSIGAYYGPQLGAALSYRGETTRDGKQFTSMVVVRAAVLK